MRALALTVVIATACSQPAKHYPVPEPPQPGSGAGSAAATPKAIETPALLAQPLANDPTHTTIHRLSNGMTVYISTDREVPTVITHIAVRAGAARDPRQSTGLAHYLEHLMFKGTASLGTLDYAREKPHLEKIASLYAELRTPNADRERILAAIDTATQDSAAFAVPNELDALYARMGISGLNAFTNSDATVYVSEVPRNRLAQWARVEAQRFAEPVFRLFWPELEAVYEEKNISLDDPNDRVSEATMLALFPDHAYGWNASVLGDVEHLKSPAYADMVAFFQRYYTPGNIAIVLAGDVDASVLPLLEKELGSIKRAAGDAPTPGTVRPLARRTEVTVTVPSDEGVALAWPTVAATHPDALPLALMDRVLHDGDFGMISRELLIPQKVETAHSEATHLREAGYFSLSADALDGQSHAELEALLLGLVGKLQRGEFTEQELATAVLTYDVTQQTRLESNEGRIELATDAFISGRDWHDVVARVDRMRAVTKADIVRVAKQYLTPNAVVVKKVKGETTPPKITKPHITPVKVDPSRQTVFAKSILAMAVVPIEPVAIAEGKDYQRTTLPTGPVIAVANRRNELATLTYDYDYGRADDRLACLAIGTLELVGSGTRSAIDIGEQLHSLGVSVGTDCSKDSTTISLSGPDKNLEAALALVRARLATPALDDKAVAARIATVLTERANALANPQTVQDAQLQYAWFGADSEQLVVPTNAQVRAVTPAQIKKLLGRYLALSHRTAYFGPRSLEAIRGAIALGDGKQVTKPPRPERYRKPNAVFATDLPTAQMQIWLAWPRKPANDNERARGRMFSEYASLLLYQEVREARGLAYTVFGSYAAGDHRADDASLTVYAGVQGDKLHDALDAILATLRSAIDDKRFEQAKESLGQSHRVDRIRPRAIAHAVYGWLDQGEASDPRAARTARALAIDKADLQQWLTALLGQPYILSLAGDKKHVDAGKLAKLGPTTTWVAPAKLFGY